MPEAIGDAFALQLQEPDKVPRRRPGVHRTGKPVFRVISLGAGVQSTTLALMAAAGEIGPMPDCAIFADTNAEPPSVYRHLEWLMSPGVLPFPVHVLSGRDLRADIMQGQNSTGHRWASIPYFLDRSEVGERAAMGIRQCTKEYKIEPLNRAQRKLGGWSTRGRIPNGACEVWIGISTDEAQRMKPARTLWQSNRWPLIELGMSRSDCLAYLARRQVKAPKSACTFCPYRSDESWQQMKALEPEAFAQACEVDEALREATVRHRLRLRAVPYIHRSLVPLREAVFDPAKRGPGADLFGNECEGICGV